MKADQEAFVQLWDSLGFMPNSEALAAYRGIESSYTDPRRQYHTLDHIAWGLERIAEVSGFEAGNWQEITWAWWFHDYVLDEYSGEENMSADEAAERAKRGGASTEFCELVDDLVSATSHELIPTTQNEALICDIDLSIFGASEDRFDEYERKVRLEYQHVPENLFRAARHEILMRFCQRPHIYMTDYCRDKWEKQAGENLERSMVRLGSWNAA